MRLICPKESIALTGSMALDLPGHSRFSQMGRISSNVASATRPSIVPSTSSSGRVRLTEKLINPLSAKPDIRQAKTMQPLTDLDAKARRLPPCSFVIPCLNEAESLGLVLKKIASLRTAFISLEVILVDNGSSDGSIEHAREFGVRVLHCEARGYGSALRKGIANASNEIVVFADADNTYDWAESIPLVQTLVDERLDLVVGNRLRGSLEPEAMPFLNRWLGTPLLSFLITLLFGLSRATIVGDCNGGMRAFRRAPFDGWGTRSTGMEFASEMIVRALLTGARYRELPITYRRPLPGRKSHIRRWRDGLRHLREILYLFCFQKSV